jgi:hypothetical protein
MRRLLAGFGLLIGVALTVHAAAPSVVIYRCTDAFGGVTLQNKAACPKGSHQQKQVIESPTPMPAYRPVESPAAPPPEQHVESVQPTAPDAKPAPVVADADRLPPPALYQCNTFDNDQYLSETATPEPRCVRLQTTDLQGEADNGAGVACQMVTDQCQRIADGAACASWKQRLRETQAALTFARPEDAAPAKLEYERVQKIVGDSTCGR